MKRINALRIEPYGLFIDQEHGVVAIDTSSGTILLDEGDGNDCFHGAAIPPEACKALELRPDRDEQSQLILNLNVGSPHSLGLIEVTNGTEEWLDVANSVIKAHRARKEEEATRNVSCGITRIDQPEKKNFGFYVRLTAKGAVYQNYFPDHTSGGQARALEMARDYRDYVMALCRLREEESLGSGVEGVTQVTGKSDGGKALQYWQAAWVDETRNRRTAKFSICRYGEEEALLLAIRARKKALRAVSGHRKTSGRIDVTTAKVIRREVEKEIRDVWEKDSILCEV